MWLIHASCASEFPRTKTCISFSIQFNQQHTFGAFFSFTLTTWLIFLVNYNFYFTRNKEKKWKKRTEKGRQVKKAFISLPITVVCCAPHSVANFAAAIRLNKYILQSRQYVISLNKAIKIVDMKITAPFSQFHIKNLIKKLQKWQCRCVCKKEREFYWHEMLLLLASIKGKIE